MFHYKMFLSHCIGHYSAKKCYTLSVPTRGCSAEKDRTLMLCSRIGCGSGEQRMLVNEHASSIVPDRVDTTKCETNFMMVVGWTSATLTMEC